MTLEDLKMMATHKYGMKEGFVDFLEQCLSELSHSKFNKEFIDVKYVDNEYGKSASELGLIKHAYPGDAGIDLPIVLNAEQRKHGNLVIYPGERERLHTGMALAFPEGYWGRIVHRSSTEKMHRLRVIEGVIDQYRGEILVQVHNMNTFPIPVEHGQRLAQIILVATGSFKARVVKELPPSVRSDKGFGSSGA